MIPTDVSESIRATSFSDMVDKYSTINSHETILVGDLFNAYKVVPKQFWNFGDLPLRGNRGALTPLHCPPTHK